MEALIKTAEVALIESKAIEPLNVVVPVKIDVPLKTPSEMVGLARVRFVATPPVIVPPVIVEPEKLLLPLTRNGIKLATFEPLEFEEEL